MSSSCASPAPEPGRTCPISGTAGTPVARQTVKALLTECALGRLSPSSHRFCPEAACPVVYFDAAGHCYTTAEVRVPIWQKEPFGARMVCYCFGENEADICDETARLGRSGAVVRIRRHIEHGRCACDVRNPLGVCCLGDLTAAVRRVAESLADAREADRTRAGCRAIEHREVKP